MSLSYKKLSRNSIEFRRITGVDLSTFKEIAEKVRPDWSKQQLKKKCHRGLNDETIKRFRLGHDAKSNEIIIPYNAKNSYYIARSITERKYRKPLTSDAGSEPIFNEEALYRDDKSPIFVTEG